MQRGDEGDAGSGSTASGWTPGAPRCPADAPPPVETGGSPITERLTLGALIAWCTLIGLVDAVSAGDTVLTGLLLTGPLVAALRASARTTAIVAAYATALGLLLGWPDDMFLTADHVARVVALGLAAGLVVVLARMRERLERARFEDSLIADAGVVIGSALDHEVSLIEFARLCARRLSDWCFVFLKDDDGSIRQLAAAHADPARQQQAWELLIRYPLHTGRPEGPAKVIRTGRPDLQPHVSDLLLRAIAADDENMRMLRALRLVSAMVVPLAVRGRVLGAIAFASAESGRIYGPEDLRLAEKLGARAAMGVDNARLYGRLHDAEAGLRGSRDELHAILDGVADAVTAQAPDGRIVYANDAAARGLGLESGAELMGTSAESLIAHYRMFDEDGREFPAERLPGRRAMRGEQPEPALVRYQRSDTGEQRWSLIKATAIRDEEGQPILAINVIEDVTEQRERERELRFLADSGRVLGSSLEWQQTFPEIALMAAGRLADWCAIEVLGEDGTPRLAAFEPSDPGEERPAPALPSHRALTEGNSEILAYSMAVPMLARGRVVGAISLGSDERSPRFVDADLLLAEELAMRCALALDNSRLFRERSKIARTLQESLLPPLLPELPGLDLAARFRAAGEGFEVGGDFYDLFETGDSAWAVAIGDVCGKGSEAAAITALARYTVRAAAMRQDGPSQILALLNEALLRQRAGKRFCTVLYGRLERNGDGQTFEFASGGHPLPLVLRANEPSEEVGAPGTLLGIVPDPELRDERVRLGAGDALVLYTDGVTDSGAPRRIWTAPELADAVGSPVGLDADTIAARVMEKALSAAHGEPRDDMAILVLKVPEPG